MKTGIGLGSNLGNRAELMAAARTFVYAHHEGPVGPLCSALYETDPVDCTPDSMPFLNAVVEIDTPLPPAMLLARLQSFEQAAGRPQHRAKNTPRAIDLDLLYAGDLLLDTPALILPHPRMTTRRFVMQPLADIRPDLVLPPGETGVASLLAALPSAPSVRLIARRW